MMAASGGTWKGGKFKSAGGGGGGSATATASKPAGTTERIKDMGITVESKSGDITKWRNQPGNQQFALNAAHQYAKKDKRDMFIFDNNSFMSRVLNIADSGSKTEMVTKARSSNRLNRAEGWAPGIRVTPAGKVFQERVYF